MATDDQLPGESSQGHSIELAATADQSLEERSALTAGSEEEKAGRVLSSNSPDEVETIPQDGGSEAMASEDPPQKIAPDDVTRTMVETAPSEDDTDIAAEASAVDPEVLPADGMSELRRLRDLVFASRGSRANLPPGWEDGTTSVEQSNVAAEAHQEVVSKSEQSASKASSSEKTPVDEAAQKMLQRAIDLVGQYASDSNSDDDDSSDSDSSSSSASASSTTRPASKSGLSKKIVTATALSDDEDEGGAVGGQGPTTKNEVLEPTVDQPPYSIVPMEKEIRPLGKIHSIVDCVVVVAQDVGKAPGQQQQHQQQMGSANGYRKAPIDMHGRKGEEEGEYSVLDTGSLLAFADRNVLGVVYETFGSVLSPLYALRYSSASQVNRDMIPIGKPVYYVPSDSTYVLTRALRALGKGSDASNLWDEEVGDDEREFSDDEAEAEHKRTSKAAKGKGKKRTHPEESTQRNIIRPGQSRQIVHTLPTRPMMAPPSVHRDGSQQDMTLPYDDEETVPAHTMALPLPPNVNIYSPLTPQLPHHSAPAPPSHDSYALWQYQQQQQQYQSQYQQPALSPAPYHYQQNFYQPMQQQPYFQTTQPGSESYNPQRPYLGRPPAPQ